MFVEFFSSAIFILISRSPWKLLLHLLRRAPSCAKKHPRHFNILPHCKDVICYVKEITFSFRWKHNVLWNIEQSQWAFLAVTMEFCSVIFLYARTKDGQNYREGNKKSDKRMFDKNQVRRSLSDPQRCQAKSCEKHKVLWRIQVSWSETRLIFR